MTAMPRTGEEWTVDDLDRLPDDGLQYELLDGLLLVTPAPIPVHQRAIGNLFILLHAACPAGFEVFLAPLVLAVEVLSPSTRRKDHVLKRSKYEESGVASYWIVDPEEPSSLAPDLTGGLYTTSAQVAGDEPARLSVPFAIDVTAADLVRPGRSQPRR